MRVQLRQSVIHVLLAAGALALTTCGQRVPVQPSLDAEVPEAVSPPSESASPPEDPPPLPPPIVEREAVFVGAGDIGHCHTTGARRTGELLDRLPGTVFTLGDNAYSSGTLQNFADCYDPYWGRQRHRTRPSPGNHDYETPGAFDYYAYFAGQADGGGEGYYHFSLAGWSIYSLNSNLSSGPGTPQYSWLASHLAQNPSQCTLAYWHHPVVSSGRHGGYSTMKHIWRLLAEHGAELVLAAHDHVYERYAPMDAVMRPVRSGMRQIIAGTGGAPLYPFTQVQPGSEVRFAVWGVLQLNLRQQDYSWEFIPVAGESARDHGEDACH